MKECCVCGARSTTSDNHESKNRY